MKRKHKTKIDWSAISIHISIFTLLVVSMIFIPEGILQSFLGIDLRKILKIILALASIQVLGIVLLRWFNSHAGTALHGFLSGLISSTALTVTLSRKSNTMTSAQKSVESLSFLSATLAMLVQGLFLALITVPSIPFKVMSLFIFPIITTILLMIRRSIHTKDVALPVEKIHLNWFSVLRLALFICVILGLSSHAKEWVGDLGFKMVTFIISLFEAHGSIIASSQMFSSKSIDIPLYTTLIFLAILSSYVSKLGIVYIMGHSYLKRKITIWSSAILITLLLSYYL